MVLALCLWQAASVLPPGARDRAGELLWPSLGLFLYIDVMLSFYIPRSFHHTHIPVHVLL